MIEAIGEPTVSAVNVQRWLAMSELATLNGNAAAARQALQTASRIARTDERSLSLEAELTLARSRLRRGDLQGVERSLEQAKAKAEASRFRPMEALASLLLAQLHLERGNEEKARQAALETSRIAERFSGRPYLFEGYAVLGDALVELGREAEALDTYAKAISTLDWIRGSLPPERVDGFMSRPDVQEFLSRMVATLQAGGNGAAAAPLKKWLPETVARSSS